MKKNLVMFDFDGVLIDSERNMAAAWAAVQTKFDLFHIPFTKYFRHIGLPFQAILNILFQSAKPSAPIDFAGIEETYFAESARNMHLVQLYPGAYDILVTLKANGFKLALITSKRLDSTERLLKQFAMSEMFDFVSTPTSLQNSFCLRGKPAPDHLMYTMARLNEDPETSVYVGDMESDAIAANRAFVDYFHASWGYGTITPGMVWGTYLRPVHATNAMDFEHLTNLLLGKA